jgi:hypothetical protein
VISRLIKVDRKWGDIAIRSLRKYIGIVPLLFAVDSLIHSTTYLGITESGYKYNCGVEPMQWQTSTEKRYRTF